MRSLLLVLALLLPAPTVAQPRAAQPVAPAPAGRLTLTTDRVVVFKDGHTLISKTATGVIAPDGTVFTEEVPDAAVLGCFWASAEGASIRSMKAEWVEEKSERSTPGACLTVLDLLRANRGKAVTLGLATRDGASLTGTIAEVLEGPAALPAEEAASPPIWNGARPAAEPAPVVGERVRPLVRTGGDLVVIDLADGTRVVQPVPLIQTVGGAGLVTTTTRQEHVVRSGKRLTFQLASAVNAPGTTPVTLRLFYFSPGIRWIPTYRVNTGAPTDPTAELSLQGEILNELEDIAGARIDLVVGVPNFRFKGLISPLSLERELRNALATAAPQLMNQRLSNAMFSQRASEYTAGSSPGSGPESALTLAPELAQGAAGEQDLFVYTLDRLDLKKGARAALPLWTSTARVEHVYTLECRIGPRPMQNHRQDWPDENPESPLRLADGRVWHQLELHNQSTTPWTTGAALLLRDGLPLGQDMLTYTPVKSCTLLPITVAMDVQASIKEEELERTHGALKINGTSYTKLKNRATVTLSNFRTLPSNIRISAVASGAVIATTGEATVRVSEAELQESGRQVNSRLDISWSFSLEPGEKKTVSVEFEVYVP